MAELRFGTDHISGGANMDLTAEDMVALVRHVAPALARGGWGGLRRPGGHGGKARHRRGTHSSILPLTQAALRTLEWVGRAENVAVGPSGTGKSHFVEALPMP